MILSTGTDIVEIKRIASSVSRYGDKFLGRIFTSDELDICKEDIRSLSGRFAAKEAVAKALGTGIGLVSWKEIEIGANEAGRPALVLYGCARESADAQGLSSWSLSITHTDDLAVAFVVAIGQIS